MTCRHVGSAKKCRICIELKMKLNFKLKLKLKLKLKTPLPAIGLLAIYGSRGNTPTLKNYALPSDLEAKSLECDDYAKRLYENRNESILRRPVCSSRAAPNVSSN